MPTQRVRAEWVVETGHEVCGGRERSDCTASSLAVSVLVA